MARGKACPDCYAVFGFQSTVKDGRCHLCGAVFPLRLAGKDLERTIARDGAEDLGRRPLPGRYCPDDELEWSDEEDNDATPGSVIVGHNYTEPLTYRRGVITSPSPKPRALKP